MSDLINQLTAERDRHVIGYPGPRRDVAELLDKAITALSEAEQRVNDARRVALEEAANIVGTLAEAFTRIGEHPEADSKKTKEFSGILEISSSAIRALQSEERQ